MFLYIPGHRIHLFSSFLCHQIQPLLAICTQEFTVTLYQLKIILYCGTYKLNSAITPEVPTLTTRGVSGFQSLYIARGNLSGLTSVVITGVLYLNMTPETYCMRTATLRRRCRKVKDADDHQAVMAFVASTTSSGEEASH